jgi:hypothetical protein
VPLAFFGLKERRGQSGFENAIDCQNRSFDHIIKTIFLFVAGLKPQKGKL